MDGTRLAVRGILVNDGDDLPDGRHVAKGGGADHVRARMEKTAATYQPVSCPES